MNHTVRMTNDDTILFSLRCDDVPSALKSPKFGCTPQAAAESHVVVLDLPSSMSLWATRSTTCLSKGMKIPDIEASEHSSSMRGHTKANSKEHNKKIICFGGNTWIIRSPWSISKPFSILSTGMPEKKKSHAKAPAMLDHHHQDLSFLFDVFFFKICPFLANKPPQMASRSTTCSWRQKKIDFPCPPCSSISSPSKPSPGFEARGARPSARLPGGPLIGIKTFWLVHRRLCSCLVVKAFAQLHDLLQTKFTAFQRNF